MRKCFLLLYVLLWASGRQPFVCVYYYLNVEYKLFIKFPEWVRSQKNGDTNYKEICLDSSCCSYCDGILSDS